MGDEFENIAQIGRGMDKLFKEIEQQQTDALVKMSSMAKLMDFKV